MRRNEVVKACMWNNSSKWKLMLLSLHHNTNLIYGQVQSFFFFWKDWSKLSHVISFPLSLPKRQMQVWLTCSSFCMLLTAVSYNNPLDTLYSANWQQFQDWCMWQTSGISLKTFSVCNARIHTMPLHPDTTTTLLLSTLTSWTPPMA